MRLVIYSIIGLFFLLVVVGIVVSKLEPQEPLSFEARKLAAQYNSLMRFKDNADFHLYCYGVGGPYSRWAEDVQESAVSTITLFSETGITPDELWIMGWEYCQNGGRETERTREIKANMKAVFLEAMP